jgi:hypothetical protein
MDEQAWLDSDNLIRLLDHLQADADSRKTLLLTAACFHRLWQRLPKECRDWARRAESVAKGAASPNSLQETWEQVEDVLAYLDARHNGVGSGTEFSALLDIATVRWLADWPQEEGATAWTDERQAQAVLVREVFGNPFRLVSLDPAWRTPAILHLAQAVYDDRAFDHLPILADALEEAGGTNGEVLDHCRSPGPHVRGCWVVDLVLGKG